MASKTPAGDAEPQRGPQQATAEQRAAQGRDPSGYWECRAQESDLGRDGKQLEAGG